MIIRTKKSPRLLGLDEPIRHESHKAPVTRRDFIAQGMKTGPAIIAAPAALAMLIGSDNARAMSPDLEALLGPAACAIQAGAGKIPFIAFDLAGGANLTGSEMLCGQSGNPLNFLSTQGYATLGLPGNMTPGSANAASPTNNFVNTEFGAAWHSDGAILRGMQASTLAATRANVNGFPIAARSENDTGNNPHNPMYGINRVGADGQLLTLIGSQNTDSGGNSMAPAAMMNPAARPTKVDRASDVTGLVDTGELGTLFSNQDDAIAVLESMTRLSHAKVNQSPTKLAAQEAALHKLVRCGYLKSTYLADRFRTPAALNPNLDPHIVAQASQPGGITPIFTAAEYNADGEFRKAAAIMKMVINGYAGAGTVTMGGYDYHGQGRNTGETRNFRAGRCIGACLEYAARMGKPLMIYVFSDGSLSANGMVNNTVEGRGKLDWASDNQSTAAPFVLVYKPGQGRPQLRSATRMQIGSLNASGNVVTSSSPAANAVNLLVETVILNYMALHGEEGNFPTLFPSNGLGSVALRDSLTMIAPLVNGTVSNPV
ncbi:MAG TPA: hypothetical protein VEW08_13320 [Steroidobacteraceae bacterium]|nr:hypothetical protein [Steroidobacteraceae bacterium]